MNIPSSERQNIESGQAFEAVTCILAEAVAAGCGARIIDLAQSHYPEWGVAAGGSGVIALAFTAAAIRQWGIFHNASVTGNERRQTVIEK